MRRTVAVLMLLASSSVAVAGERYIVPVFGVQARGSDGVYSSILSLNNPSNEPINAHIVAVLPLSTSSCEQCQDLSPDLTVNPRRSLVISDQGAPRIAVGDSSLSLGALVLEADRPLLVESEVFRAPVAHWTVDQWQVVEIARDWIAGGQVSILPRVIPPQADVSFNLFLLNPNAFPARFEYWTDCGGRGETVVAGKSTALVSLTGAFLGQICGTPPTNVPKGFALPVYVRSESPYLAAVSTRSQVLPPVVHVARPVE
ncbi:MAG TPA: hypothetical protein VNN08_25315 [Thermoanaerobaculia bacterium]|nr:hypothetical protein [Thermoanaerobaculia bacterium]